MIPEGHHLETRLKKDKSSAPKRDPGVIVLRTIAVSVSVPLTFTLVDTLLGFDPEINIGVQERATERVPTRSDLPPREKFSMIGDSVPNSSEESETSEDSIPKIDENSEGSEKLDAGSNQGSEPERPLAESDSDERTSENVRKHWVQIPRYCNGLYAGSANFRASPSLLPSEIKGVVIVGQWVSLTGQTAYGDGILWYESVNQTALNASAEPEAQNQLNAGQPGWIAACFVG